MLEAPSDALVLFGASGDLAAKMIYPALQELQANGRLMVPIIGVGRAGWDHARFVEHVRASLDSYDRVRDDTFASLIPRLRYIDGDLRDVTTFARVRVALGAVRHPLHYLAIPPSLFAATVQGLAHAGCTQSAHVAVEKPFGHDLASAQELNAVLRGIFDEPAILRVDHFLANEPLQSLLYLRCANTFVEPLCNREHIRSVQITMAEDFGVGTRGQFYDHVGATQDVVQNHVLQVLAMLAMEPPAAADAEAMHASRIRLLEA